MAGMPPMCAKIGPSRSGWSSRVRSLLCTEQIEERNTDLQMTQFRKEPQCRCN